MRKGYFAWPRFRALLTLDCIDGYSVPMDCLVT